jgi:hypothetical protein
MFALVFFPVSGYLGAMATGALEFYDYSHDFIVILCAPFVITLLSYFVDHLQIINLLTGEAYRLCCLPVPRQTEKRGRIRNYNSVWILVEKATMTIYDGASGGAIKEYPFAGDSANGFKGNYFWISDGWFLKSQEFFIVNARNFETSKRNGSIFNYVTDEEVSFAPEWIIGYGHGVILTSNLTEKTFTGITVYLIKKSFTGTRILKFPE